MTTHQETQDHHWEHISFNATSSQFTSLIELPFLPFDHFETIKTPSCAMWLCPTDPQMDDVITTASTVTPAAVSKKKKKRGLQGLRTSCTMVTLILVEQCLKEKGPASCYEHTDECVLVCIVVLLHSSRGQCGY